MCPYVTPERKTMIDGHTFILPEDFFAKGNLSTFIYPNKCSLKASDNNPEVVPATTTGAIFRLGSNYGQTNILLVQFVRPTVWRIRFDPSKRSACEYTDFNSRTVIMDTLQTLRKHLDEMEGVIWETSLSDVGEYYSLQVGNPTS